MATFRLTIGKPKRKGQEMKITDIMQDYYDEQLGKGEVEFVGSEKREIKEERFDVLDECRKENDSLRSSCGAAAE